MATFGDDGRAECPTIFFLHGDDLSGLEVAARALNFALEPTSDGDGLVLEKMLGVDAISFSGIASLMDGWARRFHADYDGWEWDVVTFG